MSETTDQTLSGVAETLLIPLYVRAMESQRPDAMTKDEKAVQNSPPARGESIIKKVPSTKMRFLLDSNRMV